MKNKIVVCRIISGNMDNLISVVLLVCNILHYCFV